MKKAMWVLLLASVFLIAGPLVAKDRAAKDAAKVLECDLDGQLVKVYLMWGENPHQSWQSHYNQNKYEAKALQDGAFQVRRYMEKNPRKWDGETYSADWVFCLLEPPAGVHWRLCGAQFLFFYYYWHKSELTGVAGDVEECEIRSLDYIFTDRREQFLLIPGARQRLEFPNGVIGTTADVSSEATAVSRIPVWIAFPQGSLKMRPIDEYRMKINLPDRIAIYNWCGKDATWFEAMPKGGE